MRLALSVFFPFYLAHTIHVWAAYVSICLHSSLPCTCPDKDPRVQTLHCSIFGSTTSSPRRTFNSLPSTSFLANFSFHFSLKTSFFKRSKLSVFKWLPFLIQRQLSWGSHRLNDTKPHLISISANALYVNIICVPSIQTSKFFLPFTSILFAFFLFKSSSASFESLACFFFLPHFVVCRMVATASISAQQGGTHGSCRYSHGTDTTLTAQERWGEHGENLNYLTTDSSFYYCLFRKFQIFNPADPCWSTSRGQGQ